MNSIILRDEENNTFLEIINECYMNRIRYKREKGDYRPPDLFEISDECLEFVTDYGIRTVTYRGIITTSIMAIDVMLKDVLLNEGYVFGEQGSYYYPHRIKVFDIE